MTFLPTKALNTAAHSLDFLQSQAWLPPALLLLALSSVFIFGGGQRGYFNRGGPHDQISAKNMGIVEHMSIEHPFLMFRGQTLGADDEPAYRPYNRFPIGSYTLIKLATLPFEDNLLAKIYAARMLMLLFFAAAAALAYLSLCRLASSRWIALTATLTAFSATACLYYSDAITGEATVDLFAVMLVFHGMAIFEQEGRFPQLPLKACIALLLGWHVYALLLPFIAFGLMREFIKTRSAASTTASSALHQLRHTALSLMRSRYLALGAIALFFGISVLTFNFTNEYLALNREVPLTETPSFNSMMNRTGVDPYIGEALLGNLSWSAFLERQFYRIGIMSLPYALSPSYVLKRMSTYNFVDDKASPQRLFVVLGIATFGATLIGLRLVRRHKILLSTLALSGFCWALPMRYTTAFPNHNFEAIFYIGVTLTLFSLGLLWLRRGAGERLITALSIVALPVFVVSALRVAQPIFDAETSESHQAMAADLESIRNVTAEGAETAIWAKAIPGNAFSTAQIYLSKRIVIFRRDGTAPPPRPSDLIIANMRIDELTSLTPRNQALFLYRWDDYQKHIDETIAQAGEPLIRSDLDVYLNDNTLIYAKDNCRLNEPGPWLFLALYPVDESDLPDERRRHGFDNLDFRFEYQAVRIGERCIARTPLPKYDIARIYTGQYIQRADGSFEHLWEGEIHMMETAR